MKDQCPQLTGLAVEGGGYYTGNYSTISPEEPLGIDNAYLALPFTGMTSRSETIPDKVPGKISPKKHATKVTVEPPPAAHKAARTRAKPKARGAPPSRGNLDSLSADIATSSVCSPPAWAIEADAGPPPAPADLAGYCGVIYFADPYIRNPDEIAPVGPPYVVYYTPSNPRSLGLGPWRVNPASTRGRCPCADCCQGAPPRITQHNQTDRQQIQDNSNTVSSGILPATIYEFN